VGGQRGEGELDKLGVNAWCEWETLGEVGSVRLQGGRRSDLEGSGRVMTMGSPERA